MVMGDLDAPETLLGPLVDKAQFQRVLRFIGRTKSHEVSRRLPTRQYGTILLGVTELIADSHIGALCSAYSLY
jgi:acyl-CoA reductase-like NAD-dependent aldehyde dehydrogenase